MSTPNLRTIIALAIALIAASGCVVRTQQFHCVSDTNPSETFEMAMSPTSLTYRSQRLAFAEERGADRLYRLDSAGLEALFNPPSRRLLVRSGAIQQSWTCTRYEPL